MKERNILLDNIKGILIFLVVFGHFLYYPALNNVYSTANDIFIFIYTFHMPAFIFISGILSKKENTTSPRNLIKLLLYYLVFNSLMMLFYYFYFGTPINLFTPYNSYWYLLSLIIWRLTIKHLNKIKGILPISIALSLLIGYCSYITNNLSLNRTIAFFPFFLLGYKLEAKILKKVKKPINIFKKIFYILITLIFISILFLYIQNKNLTPSMLMMESYQNITDIKYRLIIFSIAIIAIILLFLTSPSQKIPLLTKIGENSLAIYLIHRFLPYAFLSLLPLEEYNSLYIVYAFIASIITVLILGSNIVNKSLVKIFNSLFY